MTAASHSGDIGGVTGPSWLKSAGAQFETRGFIVSGRSVKYFPTTIKSGVRLHSINNHGDVVGSFIKSYASPEMPIIHAFLWRRGKMLDLTPDAIGAALCINDRGEVGIRAGVGMPFVWRRGKLHKLPAPHSVVKIWIDSHGDVLGEELVRFNSARQSLNAGVFDITRGLLWHDGKATDIGSLGGQATDPQDMNDAGAIVGNSQTTAKFMHGFLRRNGKMQDLGVPTGAREVRAERIKNAGVVAGLAGDQDGDVTSGKGTPFVWSHGHFVAYGLDSSAAKDWQIENIVAVGPGSAVLANGQYRGSSRACLMVPETSR